MRTITKRRILAGTTSYLVEFPIEDNSVTTGDGLTALVYTTGSPLCYYSVDGAAPVAITLATMTRGTWASGGFVKIDDTNKPGMYQLGVPNAAIASGKQCEILLTGMTGASPANISIDLIALNEQVATRPRGTYTKRRVVQGSTSYLITFPIEADPIAVAAAGKTGLAYNTSSLAAYATVDGAAPVAISLVTMTPGTWASGGFAEVSSSHMPGMYQLGVPNALLASGAQVDIEVFGASGMAPAYLSLDLVGSQNVDVVFTAANRGY